jgi:5-methylthioadenosine/S-adenosylhomocysteine deaminase
MKTLIHGGCVVVLDDERHVYDPGYVLVEDDSITGCQKGEPSPDLLSDADQIIDANQKLVMPGLVNAHTHLFQTFIRGIGDDKPLQDWLQTYIWPISSNMGTYEAQLSATLGIVENIRSGTTAVLDNQYIHNTPETDDAFCQAAADLGVRFLMARGWADRNYHPAFLETGDEILERIGLLIEKWNSHPSQRIRVEFGPLSKPRCSTPTFLRMWEMAKKLGVGFHMHTSEIIEQTNYCIEEEGLRTVEWLESIGCLDDTVQLVHSIWLSENEIDLIARRNAKVIHCPVSNMILASGVAKVPEMMKKGISVALATDGPGSNNNQDMVETLKTTSLLHKVTSQDANVFQLMDLLWMACRNGADAFGQPELIGSLEPGKKADLILVDLNSAFAQPVHNPVSALIFCLHGSDVDSVMINGNFVMQNKKILIINEDDLLKECQKAAKELVSRSL